MMSLEDPAIADSYHGPFISAPRASRRAQVRDRGAGKAPRETGSPVEAAGGRGAGRQGESSSSTSLGPASLELRLQGRVTGRSGPLGHLATATPPSLPCLVPLVPCSLWQVCPCGTCWLSRWGSCLSSSPGFLFLPGSLGLTPPEGVRALDPRGGGSACALGGGGLWTEAVRQRAVVSPGYGGVCSASLQCTVFFFNLFHVCENASSVGGGKLRKDRAYALLVLEGHTRRRWGGG